MHGRITVTVYFNTINLRTEWKCQQNISYYLQIKSPYLSICTEGVAPLLEKSRLTSRVIIFREKKFSRTRKRQKFIPLEFHLFCGSENARNSVPSHSAKDEKIQNSVPNHFVEDKKARNFIISLLTIPRKIKSFVTCDGISLEKIF